MKRSMGPIVVVWTGTFAAVVVAVTAGARAQSGQKDAMTMKPMAQTYTGCVEMGSAAGSYKLSHAAADMTMPKGAMPKDAMAKDSKSQDAMDKDNIMSSTLMLTGAKVDLSKQVGHKVTVTGTMNNSMMDGAAKPDAMSMPMALAVTSMKMISKSCGM